MHFQSAKIFVVKLLPLNLDRASTSNSCLFDSGEDYEDSRVNDGYTCHMTLKIKTVMPNSFGSYRCVAVNALGETDGFIKVYGKHKTNAELSNPTLPIISLMIIKMEC